MAEVVTSYYLRLRVADQAGVLAKVTGLLADAGISIDAVLQREADEVGGEGSTQTDLIILTHDTREGTLTTRWRSCRRCRPCWRRSCASARKSSS